MTKKQIKETDDSELVNQALMGSQRAKSALYSKYQKEMTKVAASFVKSKEQAEDIVADSFVKVFSNLEQLKGLEGLPFKNWLVRITSNSARDYLRSAQNKIQQGALSEEEKLINFNSASDNKDSYQQLAAKEQASIIMEHIKDLPSEYAFAIKEHYFNDKSTKEIAEEAGISVAGVTQRLSRGRELLRQSLDPKLFKAVQLFFESSSMLLK